jgi:hypothetical protein
MSLFSVSCLALAFAPGVASAQTAPVPAPAETADAHLQSRHGVGVQLGGSSVFELVYRLRLLGHSYLELGLGGLPEGALIDGSAGLMVAFSRGTRWFPYVAGGFGFATMSGPTPATCDSGTSTGCPWQSDGVGFGYARAGGGYAVGRHASIEVDHGAWMGEKGHTSVDGAGVRTSSSRRFVWPMAGAACIWSF